MPFSLRLDAETDAKIRRLSAATGRSKSEVVREAVAEYVPDEGVAPAGESTYDRLKSFAGVIGTGGGQYSTETHAKYRARLERKRSARRSR